MKTEETGKRSWVRGMGSPAHGTRPGSRNPQYCCCSEVGLGTGSDCPVGATVPQGIGPLLLGWDVLNFYRPRILFNGPEMKASVGL